MADDPLSEPLSAYLKEAVNDLHDSNRIYMLPETKWTKDAYGNYRGSTGNRPLLGEFLHRQKDQSALYDQAVTAIYNDTDFGRAIGCMVGSESDLMLFDCDTVITYAADAVTKLDGKLHVRKPEVSRRLGELRRYFTKPHQDDKIIIPLPSLEYSRFPIQIDNGIEIDILTADEVGACIGSGVLRPMGNNFPLLPAEECLGVRIGIQSPLRIVPPQDFQVSQEDLMRRLTQASTEPHKFGTVSPWKISDCVDDLLFVLRLARSEPIGTLGAVLISNPMTGWTRAWIGQQDWNFPSKRMPYEIDQATARQIRDLWRKLKTKNENGHCLPPICQRRFNAAMERVLPEDAILDYLITAEALFLSGSGSPEERGELGFRLALRASKFLETKETDRLALYKFIKAAYDKRSQIAHGGSLPMTVKVGGEEVSVHEFVDKLSSVMRRALLTAIDKYISDKDFPTPNYWNLLVLR